MHRLIVLSAFLLMVGCDPTRLYENNRDFKNALWPSKDLAVFDLTIEDPAMKYNVILNVRNSIDFETVRLFTQYQLVDSSSTVLRKRLVEQALFDKKTGEPLGESGVGDIYEHHFVLESNIVFPAKGRYQVKLNHMMRADTLREILSVGVRLEKAQ